MVQMNENLKNETQKTIDESTNKNWNLLFICWLIATASTLGSLFFSDIMNYAPCSMCWYQRIFMYPLVVIFLTGLFPFDKNIVKYSLPLTLLGTGFAFYHTLLYSGFIPKSMQPCGHGVSCSEKYLDIFGFISIPMLSLFAFSIIAALLLVIRRNVSK